MATGSRCRSWRPSTTASPTSAPALAGLTEKELLEVDDERWSFRSDLVRDVAYGTLTKARRAAGHAGIAKWLEHHETGDQAPTAMVDRIAHHYALAAELVGDVGASAGVPDDVRERALIWLERAAEGALASEHHLVGPPPDHPDPRPAGRRGRSRRPSPPSSAGPAAASASGSWTTPAPT